MNTRIQWIDNGKGLAILLVLIGHVILGLIQSGQYPIQSANLGTVLEFIYAFHMPFFFALSGYFFKPVQNLVQWLLFVRKKLVSLGIPYVTFSCIMFALQTVGGSSVRQPTSLNQLIQIWKEPIGYLWFLYILFFLQTLLTLLSIIVKNKKIIFSILIAGYIFASVFPCGIYFIQRFLVWAPMYFLGYILKTHHLKITFKTWLLLILYIAHIFVFKMTAKSGIYYLLSRAVLNCHFMAV